MSFLKSRLAILFFLLSLILLIEWYTFTGISHYIDQLRFSQSFWLAYYFLAALSVLSTVVFVNTVAKSTAGIIKKPMVNVVSGLALTLILTKLSFSAIIFAGDIYRMGHLAIYNISAYLNDSSYTSVMIDRNIHVAQLGLAVAAFPFLSFIHGITIGKYKYKIKRVNLIFPDLPIAFNGYKILQFSDMHSGSFDSLKRVKKGIEKIQAEEADLILFTGDMVNNLADEVKPFVSMLKDLKAKDGKYSILGNHDYGDYIAWANKEAKIENLYRLINFQHEAGFHLLMNENIVLKRGNESIRLAGVENWGKPPFPQHGDLKKALSGINAEEFTVLMSHDPSHWDLEVLKAKKKIHLTLSGHTHGMQMGFDIPGLKWSPVKYKYPRWSGLYEELDRYLYVNNGFGFLGFPGRVGIYPEITVFELTSATKD